MKLNFLAVGLVAGSLSSTIAKADVPCPFSASDPNNKPAMVTYYDGQGQLQTVSACVLLDDAQRPAVLSAMQSSGAALIKLGVADPEVNYFVNNEDSIHALVLGIEREKYMPDNAGNDLNAFAAQVSQATQFDNAVDSKANQLKSVELAFGGVYCQTLTSGQASVFTKTLTDQSGEEMGCGTSPINDLSW